jgi:hypothetical protein
MDPTAPTGPRPTDSLTRTAAAMFLVGAAWLLQWCPPARRRLTTWACRALYVRSSNHG